MSTAAQAGQAPHPDDEDQNCRDRETAPCSAASPTSWCPPSAGPGQHPRRQPHFSGRPRHRGPAPSGSRTGHHGHCWTVAVPVLSRFLAREGHIPVHRGDRRAAAALGLAVEALEQGSHLLIYAEGGLPRRKDAAEAVPGDFRSGLSRLAERVGAPVVPVGQAGARRVTSGSAIKQIAGLATAPVRRPELHVHAGAPVVLSGDSAVRTARAPAVMTGAWRTAAAHLAEPAALAA